MVVRYTDFPAGEKLRPVDGQLTPSSEISDTRGDWGNVGHGHLNTDGVTHDGGGSDSISRRHSERGLCVMSYGLRSVHMWIAGRV